MVCGLTNQANRTSRLANNRRDEMNDESKASKEEVTAGSGLSARLGAGMFNFSIKRYLVNDTPRCATDWRKGDVCVFLRLRGMCGKSEVCGFTETPLNRDDNGTGYLVPCAECPVWQS